MNNHIIEEAFELLKRYIAEQDKRMLELETRLSAFEGNSIQSSCFTPNDYGEPQPEEMQQSQTEKIPPTPEDMIPEEIAPEVYYSGRAIKMGDETYFEENTFKAKPFFYIIEATGNTATYRLNTEDKYQKRYMSDFENIIIGTCKIEGSTKPDGKLYNVTEGKLHREEDKWMIDEFLVVKFE